MHSIVEVYLSDVVGEEEQGDNDQDEANDINDTGENQNDYDYDNSSMINEGSVYETSQNENSEPSLTPNGSNSNTNSNGSSSQPKPPVSNTGNNNNTREVFRIVLITFHPLQHFNRFFCCQQRSQPKMRFSRSVSPPRSTTPHGY